uniref:KAP family P-loop NTPase fold protein n=1 Tax=Methanobrevibacter smithii TaxID=2173 RepID=UPI0037DC8748
MFKEDKDVKISGDTLNRKNFAKSLALNIQNYFGRQDVNNCLTIGLMGEWGSGKTSLLNMTEEYLKDSKIKIIKFNPWIYSSYNQLVGQFFDELIMEFTDSRDVSLTGFLRQYKIKVNELELAKKLAVVGTSLIDSRLGSGVERILGSSSEEENLAYLKKKIDEQFTGRKVVCIIDDLDRLSKDEIAEMFKLIKIMADFKNMVYLVSFDKDVVSEALKKDYGGEKYIEKIINVPLYVPSIDYTELRDFLVKHFKRISRTYKKNLDIGRLNQFLDFQPFQHGKRCGILYFFTNMRDITRFINILEFNLELIINEVNLIDFIVITAIQVFHSEIYDKIKLNEFLLINYHYTAFDELQRDILEIEKSEFEELVNKNENVNHILRVLFPKIGNIYKDNSSFKFKNEDFADKNLLIHHPNHFKAYFKLNSVIKELSESETDFVVGYINSKNKSSVVMEFTRLYKENKLTIFFENIKNRLDKIHKNKFFLNFLFNIETLMWEDIFFLNRDEIEELCLEMIYQIAKRDRFSVLKEIYQ